VRRRDDKTMTTDTPTSVNPTDYNQRFAAADRTVRFWWTAVLLGLFLVAWLVRGAAR